MTSVTPCIAVLINNQQLSSFSIIGTSNVLLCSSEDAANLALEKIKVELAGLTDQFGEECLLDYNVSTQLNITDVFPTEKADTQDMFDRVKMVLAQSFLRRRSF